MKSIPKRPTVDQPGYEALSVNEPTEEFREESRSPSDRTFGASDAGEARATKRILLVEDDADSREVYRLFLEHAGFTVSIAGDGRAGIRTAREELPDLILMDIGLPYISGWEATRTLKADPATSNIPVVAISANVFPEDRRKAESIGFEAYLGKPVTPREVLAEVERRIGAARDNGLH